MKRLLFVPFLLLGIYPGKQLYAQQPDPKDTPHVRLPVTVIGKDTFPVYALDATVLDREPDASVIAAQQEWDKYLRRVRYVYPYAQACAEKLMDVDAQLAALDRKKDRKKFLHEEEGKLRDQYTETLKNFSYMQAEVLIKLVGRMTGKTPYSLIKEYKSGFSAFSWQMLGKLYGLNLNETYDPARNADLETALKQLGLQ